jgi:hypothetical protein
MNRKKAQKKADKVMWKRFLWIAVLFAVVIFAGFMLILRSTISGISRDTSVVSLTNDAVFDVVLIMNINENKDCWAQKNPNLTCNDENKLENGNYVLRGTDLVWLEGPLHASFPDDAYIIPEELVRDALGGFMQADQTYYQIVKITLKEGELMAEIETRNDQGDLSTDTITFYQN